MSYESERIFRATFGYTKKVACVKHKEEGMIDLECKSKCCERCYEDGIFNKAIYGYTTDGKKIVCAKHKDDGMILIPLNKGCLKCRSEDNKYTLASFGYKDGQRVYCSKHKEINMVNLIDLDNSYCVICVNECKKSKY